MKYEFAINLVIMEIANIKNYLSMMITNVERGFCCTNLFKHGNIALSMNSWAIFAMGLKNIPSHDPLDINSRFIEIFKLSKT